MYKSVLLAFDGTVEGRTALREGALIATYCGAKVYLLSVVPETAGLRAAEGVYPGARVHQTATYQEVLDYGVARLRELGCEPATSLQVGDPTEIIAAFAQQVGADLIVLGHRRQSFLERWWSGSAYVVDKTSCSLLISKNAISDEAFEGEIRNRHASIARNEAGEPAPASQA